MVLGTIWVVFLAEGDFFVQFQGFLITLGVGLSAWCGIVLADLLLRRRDYAEAELYDPRGRYGAVPPVPLVLPAPGSRLGAGVATNAYAGWLQWQGYLLAPFGLGRKDGDWAFAN